MVNANIRLFSIFLFVYSLGNISAQQQLSFENISVQDGLADYTIHDIYQDSYGYIWVGTENGLNVLNSIHIKKLPLVDSAGFNRPVRNVYCFLEDENQNVLIGTDNGLFLYNRMHDEYILLSCRDSAKSIYKLSNHAIRSMIFDMDKNLWLGTYEGLNKLTPDGQSKAYLHNPNDSNTINHNVVGALFIDGKNNLVAGTSEGFAIYNPEKDNFDRYYPYRKNDITSPEQMIVTSFVSIDSIHFLAGTWGLGLYKFNVQTKSFINNYRSNHLSSKSLSGNTIFALNKDENNLIWIGTENKGLNRFNPIDNTFTSFTTQEYHNASIAGNTIKCITIDNHGDMWLGTYNGGISKLDFNKISFNHYRNNYSAKNSLSNNKVTSFLELSSDQVWIGTDGGGINIFNPDKGELKQNRYDKGDIKSIKTDIIMDLCLTKNDRIWVGTYSEGINVLNTNGELIDWYKMDLDDTLSLSGNNISKIFQDSKERIWAGVLYDVPCLYTRENYFIRLSFPSNVNYPIHDVRDILQDKQGNIWMGSNGFLYKLESFKNHKFDFSRINLFNDVAANIQPTITSIEEGENGLIWIGTSGWGIVVYSPVKNTIQRLTTEEGLPSDDISSITTYPNGSIWMSTGNGLAEIRDFNFDKKVDLRVYNAIDGLQGDIFNIGASLTTSNGLLLFGGNNGFNVFNPEKIESNTKESPVYITDIRVNHEELNKDSKLLKGKNLLFLDKMELKYDQSTLAFSFAAVDFKNTAKIKYKYRLKGLEENWNIAGDERRATYTNLKPGNYTFQVQAANSSGIWNREGVSMDVVIFPPWWQTWWAAMIYVIVVTLFVLLFRTFLLQKERKRNVLQIKKMEAEKNLELNKLKMQFFTNVSHELRTPLTLINGPVQALTSNWKYDKEQVLQLNIIKRNTKRLLQLVDQLMDFSKLESETLPFRPAFSDLPSFLNLIFKDFIHLAESKNVQYTFTKNTEAFSTWFDTDKMQKILYNLISNAFKFTRDNGKINLELRVQNDAYIIKVSDDGIGIDSDHLDNIFLPFYQAHGKYFKKFKGTGIGLSLCKSLVKIHNGEIFVESGNKEIVNGYQTVFTLKFPLLKSEEKQKEDFTLKALDNQINEDLPIDEFPVFRKPGSESVNLPAVLLVEDNADIKSFISSQLKSAYVFIFAANGREGLEKAKKHMPDIIISDIIMPEMDGVEMCNIIKNTPETSHIPIIMLTAKNEEKSILKGLETGVENYLTKPFNINVLALYINNILTARIKIQEQYKYDFSFKNVKLSTNKTDEEFLGFLIERIKHNLSEFDFGVDQLARETGMSRTNFYKKIKNISGLTVNDFIKNIKLKFAASMLLNSDMNVNEVAYNIGMKDPSYFSRCFKKTFGSLPRDFVKEKGIESNEKIGSSSTNFKL